MSYLSTSNCEICNSKLTFDDVNFYGSACFSCCSKYHKKFELAHSGKSNVNYERFPISKNLRSYIFGRDKKCLNCGSLSDLTIDHIIPISFGGDNSHSNLQCLCRKCNSVKSNYPQDYREVIE